MQDITLVDVRTPGGWVNDVADGNLDAIATSERYASAARERLGDKGVAGPARAASRSMHWLYQPIAGQNETPEQQGSSSDPGTGGGVYAHTHPVEAKAIVQRRLELDPLYMDTVWQQNQFSLSLDQSLVLAMEDEAR